MPSQLYTGRIKRRQSGSRKEVSFGSWGTRAAPLKKTGSIARILKNERDQHGEGGLLNEKKGSIR